MKAKSIITAAMLMVSTMASAQYVNVKLKDGTYHSYKATPDTEVSFGEKKGTEPTESAQTITANGHKVTVKLAENTPASEVMVCAYIEGEDVKVGAFPRLNYGLECIGDNSEALTPVVSNGYYTYTLSSLSDISKDVVVTVGYITVSFDLNNSNITDNFKDKPADITKIRYNSTIAPAYAFAEKHGFRGWYTDKECTSPWNYSTGVTKSMTLYAKWVEAPADAKINGHDYVKLAGYYWATKNVTEDDYEQKPLNKDSIYGCYYTQANDHALNAAKSWGNEGNYTWTLPSKAQWQALVDYCKWEWKTDYEYNGMLMNGMLVTGRDDTFESGHSIFLPAAGACDDGSLLINDQGNFGYYWSADDKWLLYFMYSFRGIHNRTPGIGMAVRPVLAE